MIDDAEEGSLRAVDRLARELIAVSHEIHAHPGARVRGGARCAPAGRHARRVAGSTRARRVRPRDRDRGAQVGGVGADRRAALRVRRAARDRPRLRAQHHRDRRRCGAALALAELGARLPGRVRWLGTPAEERGGGKELMARDGAFDGVDAALMIHPAGVNLATMPCLRDRRARGDLHRCRRARASAHARARRERARRAGDRVPGGRRAAPAHPLDRAPARHHHRRRPGAEHRARARGRPLLRARARTRAELAAAEARVEGCFRAGAEATGARLELAWGDGRLPRPRHLVAARASLPGQRRGARPRLLPVRQAAGRMRRARPTWAT
mgnify:CR=1 FL=1